MPTITGREGRNGKRWRCEVRLKGFPRLSETFSLRRDALAWATTTERDILTGSYNFAGKTRLNTLGDLIDHYVKSGHHERTRSLTYHRDKVRYLKFWKAELGQYALSNITPPMIAEKREMLVSRKLSPGTINRHLSGLSSLFSYASRDLQWIKYNPLTEVSRLKEPRGRVRFLNEIERKRLLRAAALERKKPMLLIIVLAIATGARKGELLGIDRPNVLLAEKGIILDETKNNERRVLYVDGYPLKLLTQYMKATARQRNRLLFPSGSGKRPMSIDREWYRILDRSGVKNFRFHDLRHTAATYLLLDGASLADVMELLGHRDIASTKRYAHLTQEHMKSVAGRVQRKIFLDELMQKGAEYGNH